MCPGQDVSFTPWPLSLKAVVFQVALKKNHFSLSYLSRMQGPGLSAAERDRAVDMGICLLLAPAAWSFLDNIVGDVPRGVLDY